MSAQDRHPPSVDQTSLDPVGEAVGRLTEYMGEKAHVSTHPSDRAREDIRLLLEANRTLLAAHAEMKEGLAVALESGSRPGQDGWRLIGHFQQTPWQGYMEVIPEAIGQDGVLALYASSENETPSEGSRETIKSLRSKLDLADKALEPFADLFAPPQVPDSAKVQVMVSVADIRLARSTLTEMRKT